MRISTLTTLSWLMGSVLAGHASAAVQGESAHGTTLEGTRWVLVEFQSMDDAVGRTVNPRPLAYTLSLEPDGKAALRLDCNRANGPWQVRPGQDATLGGFMLGPLASTRALCPDDVLGPMLARDAQYLRGYRLQDGQLHLSLMADGGIYTWAPLQQSGFDCARADSSATELICTDPDLAALDRELARLYDRARAAPAMSEAERTTLVATQRGWIKGRDDCWKADDLRQCVLANTLMRIHELRGLGDDVRAEGNPVSTGPFALDCKDAQIKASVSFVTPGAAYAYLQWNTEGIALSATPVASGMRYQGRFLDTPVVLWTQRDEARFEHGTDPARICRFKEN